jgi:hypothetical protein
VYKENLPQEIGDILDKHFDVNKARMFTYLIRELELLRDLGYEIKLDYYKISWQ